MDTTTSMNLARESKAGILAEAVASNVYWRERYQHLKAGLPKSLCEFEQSPTVDKAEILAEQGRIPPLGRMAGSGISRLHQSSGTVGHPLAWGDSPTDWNRMLDIWDILFGIAGIMPTDRFLFPFSFGPFLGFWSAFEAVARSGRFCLAGGGLSTQARLRLIERHHITVVLATPSYAQHMAETALGMGLNLASLSVRALILAGEPGASRPTLRHRLESSWGARVFDHHGMTETGPVTMECVAKPGTLHVVESSYIAQIAYLQSDGDSGEGELVLTPLDRLTMPLIRYRTGDRVRLASTPCPCGSPYMALEGGILGRLDDMLIIRGNNIHPEAIENWLWSHPSVCEFRIEVHGEGAMSRLRLMLELATGTNKNATIQSLKSGFQERFLFQADIETTDAPLPRFEMKSRRVIFK